MVFYSRDGCFYCLTARCCYLVVAKAKNPTLVIKVGFYI